jgi:hypothetical protein
MLDSSEEELSALSIWTFTLGVFALLTFGLTSLPSVICGHVALAKGKNSNGRSLGRCVTLVGLVIGYAGTALFGTSIVAVVRLLAAP